MYDKQKKLKKIPKSLKSSIICSLCNKKVISPFQCLNCNRIFCFLCLEEWRKENKNNSCPFNCLKASFKELNIPKNILKDFRNIKIKKINNSTENISENKLNINKNSNYIRNLSLLKKIQEIENKVNINELKELNSNYLSIRFKSVYHNHYLYNNVSKDYRWICDICENKFEVKSKGRYRCEPCDFDICEKCRLLEESGYRLNKIFLSRSHEHLLKDETLKQSNWICDVCDKRYEMKTVIRFRCEKCDFDICNFCKIKEIRNPNGFFYNLLISIYNLYYIT